MVSLKIQKHNSSDICQNTRFSDGFAYICVPDATKAMAISL